MLVEVICRCGTQGLHRHFKTTIPSAIFIPITTFAGSRDNPPGLRHAVLHALQLGLDGEDHGPAKAGRQHSRCVCGPEARRTSRAEKRNEPIGAGAHHTRGSGKARAHSPRRCASCGGPDSEPRDAHRGSGRSALRRSCCSSPAQMSRTCSSRACSAVSASSRCGAPSAMSSSRLLTQLAAEESRARRAGRRRRCGDGAWSSPPHSRVFQLAECNRAPASIGGCSPLLAGARWHSVAAMSIFV